MHNYFKEHNIEAEKVWDSYNAGTPIRVPLILGTSIRTYLSDPILNIDKVSYYNYHNNPDIMLDTQLKYQDYVRHNIFADHEMGLPQKWHFHIDGGNFQHSAWYGCDVHYTDYDSPDTKTLLYDDNKNMLFDKGIMDPFSGILSRYKNMHEYLSEKIIGYEYKGIPVDANIGVPAASTGGNGIPFTTACKLRGTTQMCLDMALNPEYAKQLLEYITESVIQRTVTWRKYLGMPIKTDVVSLGDDSVILLSPAMYKEFVIPCHKRIYEEFGTPDAVRGIHLCGDASKHFEILRNELNVTQFDTGFPVNLPKLNQRLGTECRINGGLHIELIRNGSIKQIDDESKNILESMKQYKKFVFRDANHIAPCTPLENMKAMYEACKKYGRY